MSDEQYGYAPEVDGKEAEVFHRLTLENQPTEWELEGYDSYEEYYKWEVELDRAKEILKIASELFAFAETQGGLTLNEDFDDWKLSGEVYEISSMSEAGFTVRDKDNNGMFLFSKNDDLYPDNFWEVGEEDLERFRELEKMLEDQSFNREQLPMDTVAIADKKWAASYATSTPKPDIDFEQ
jgi:hypothetical protein